MLKTGMNQTTQLHMTMTTIDLTSPEAALDYLRSLNPADEVELPDTGKNESNLWGDVVRAVTESNPKDFVIQYNQWTWTVGELLATLERDHKAYGEAE